MKPSTRIPGKRLRAAGCAVRIFPDALGDISRAVESVGSGLIGDVVRERIGRPGGELPAGVQRRNFQLMRARRKFHHRAPLHRVGANAGN